MFITKPELLLIAISFPIILFLAFWELKYRINFLNKWKLLNNTRKNKLKARFVIIVLLSLLLIASGVGIKIISPFAPEKKVIRKNIYFLLDVSNSIRESNLQENFINTINKLLPELKGDRIGLILYSDRAYTLVPITSDIDYFSNILDSGVINNIKGRGTDLRYALNELILRSIELDSFSTLPKLGVVFTDGEHFGTDIFSKLQRLKRLNVPLLILKYNSEKSILDSIPYHYKRSKVVECFPRCPKSKVIKEINKLVSRTPEAIKQDKSLLDLSYFILFTTFGIYLYFIFLKLQ